MFLTPNLVIGLTVMAVGVVLMLDTLGIREVSSFMKYWPGLIVLFGASIIAQAFRPPTDPVAAKRANGGVPCFFLFLLGVAMFWTFGMPGVIDGQAAGRRATATGVMSRGEGRNVTSDIRSARVAALMGRSSLDLRSVKLGPGEEVVVDVFVTMGRATVRIPDGWIVDASALPIMGAIEEDRFQPLLGGETAGETGAEKSDAPAQREAAVPPPTGPPPRLKLRGFVMMGKVEVTS